MAWWNSNPYQPSVDNLERALDYCRQGDYDARQVPWAKGGSEIAGPASTASRLIEEALAAAVQWRDAFDYHAEGDRTDF